MNDLGPTIRAGVAKDLVHFLVGGVLAQSTHDVSDLVVGDLAVTDSVEKAKGFPVV